ncbi:MAG TPA: hypothetical protein VK933_05095 [Longimicrobiales bacterium]|nr:hypothetical protein [Longimicrobiales bacterium]
MHRDTPGIALLIVVVLSAGCTTRGSSDGEAPASCAAPTVDVSRWETVDAGEFSFRLPPGLRESPVQGVDSKVGLFRTQDGAVELSYDWGWYSSDLSHDTATFSSYRACSGIIDDREALVITGQLRDPADGRAHVVAATWRNVVRGPMPVHLAIWSTARNPMSVDEMFALVHTVTFAAAVDAPFPEASTRSGPRVEDMLQSARDLTAFLRGEGDLARVALADTVVLYLAPEGGGDRTAVPREVLHDRDRWTVHTGRSDTSYRLAPPPQLSKLTARAGRHFNCLEYDLSSRYPTLAELPHVGVRLEPVNGAGCLQTWNATFVFAGDKTTPTLVAVVYDQWEW